jgi:hypothetical protein
MQKKIRSPLSSSITTAQQLKDSLTTRTHTKQQQQQQKKGGVRSSTANTSLLWQQTATQRETKMQAKITPLQLAGSCMNLFLAHHHSPFLACIGHNWNHVYTLSVYDQPSLAQLKIERERQRVVSSSNSQGLEQRSSCVCAVGMMMRNNQSLSAIAPLLYRHSLLSTFLYYRIDFRPTTNFDPLPNYSTNFWLCPW